MNSFDFKIQVSNKLLISDFVKPVAEQYTCTIEPEIEVETNIKAF